MIAGLAPTSVSEIVHHRHALAERRLRLLASGDVGPGSDDLERAPLAVVDDAERVLDPDVVSVAMPEAILDRAAAFFDQRRHLLEHARGILRMQTHRPEILVLEHLPRGEAHDAGDVLADEGAGVVVGLVGVDDRRRDRHEIAQPLARRFQLGGALVDALLQLVVRLAELFLLMLARPEVGGEADRAHLLALLVEQDRGGDQDGDARAVLGLEHAVEAGDGAAALAHLAQHVLGVVVAGIEIRGGPADDVRGAIAQQGLGALVEQHDIAVLVGGDDGVGRAFDQPRQIALGVLQLDIGLERRLLGVLALGDVGPGADQLLRIAVFVVDDLEAVLDPDVMAVAMAEAIFDAAAAALDQAIHFLEHARRIVGVEMLGPAFRVGGHLLRRIAHDRAEVLADEGAAEIAGGLGGVDDGGTDGEQILQALPRLAQLGLDGLALGDVGPGANQLRRSAGFVVDDPERVLDPDVMSVAMPEAVFDRSPAVLDQGAHLLEDSRRVLRMEMVGPAFRIGRHLLRRIAHDRAEILADEGAGEIAGGLGGVDDGGAYGEQVLHALLGALQLAFVRLAQRIESHLLR